MARQRATGECILVNVNVKAGQKSLITGQSGKPVPELSRAVDIDKEKIHAENCL